MRLVSTLIKKFKSIDNSGEVTIDPAVTVLVGQNESGKTAFLQALHKVQPVETKLAYDIIEEYPRKELTAYRKRHRETPDVVAKVTYQLSDAEISSINRMVGIELIPTGFTFTRTVKYDGSSELGGINFPEQQYVAHLLEGKNLGEETAKKARAASDVPQLIGVLTDEDLNTEGTELLKELNTRFASAKGSWSETPLSWYVWNRHISPALPQFLYFDEYSLLPDKTNLRTLRDRVEEEALKPEDRTVLALLTSTLSFC